VSIPKNLDKISLPFIKKEVTLMHDMTANDYEFKLSVIKKGINNTHFTNDNSSIYLDHKDIEGFPTSSYVGYFKNYQFKVKQGKEVPVADMYVLHKDTAVFIAGGAPFAISPTAYQKSIPTAQGQLVKDFRIKSFGIVLDPAFGERNRINPITSEYSQKSEQEGDQSDKEEDLDRTAGDMVNFVKWTNKYINTLPDSAFLYVASGGSKDSEGKTVPRSLRKLPYKNKEGKLDLPHLRNALARLGQPKTDIPDSVRSKLISKAKKILEGETKMSKEKYAKMIDKSGLKFRIQELMEKKMDFGKAFDLAVKETKFSVKKFDGANLDALRKLVDDLTIKIEAKEEIKLSDVEDIKSRIESVIAFEDPENESDDEDIDDEDEKDDEKDNKKDKKKDKKLSKKKDEDDNKDDDKGDDTDKDDNADSKDKDDAKEGEGDDSDSDSKDSDEKGDSEDETDKDDDKDDNKDDKGDAYAEMKKLAESSIKDFTEMEEKFNKSDEMVKELETENQSLKENIEGFKVAEYDKIVTVTAEKVAKCHHYDDDRKLELIETYKSKKLSVAALEELGSVADSRLKTMSKKPQMVTKHSSELDESGSKLAKEGMTKAEQQDAQIDSLMGTIEKQGGIF